MTAHAQTTSKASIHVTLNGEARELPAGLSLSAMLTHLGLDPRKVAVERNLEIAPRSAYGDIDVADGDRLEIVQFVGGG
ncbi:MAG: sulfur carrier protein ThiS [Oceanicaulis sp. HLUCCA04]|nr:MAG: sulfur carrier protein ThiS [Oceanicaulis sp. HLUCCA04]